MTMNTLFVFDKYALKFVYKLLVFYKNNYSVPNKGWYSCIKIRLGYLIEDIQLLGKDYYQIGIIA